MSCRVFLALFTTCALVGCASPQSPFQATWFLEDSPLNRGQSQKRSQTIYVMLVNRSADSQRVDSVIINQAGDDQNTGWRLNGPFQLEPGEVVVRPATDFVREGENGEKHPFQSKCHLPTSVAIEIDKASVRADMSGRLPSSLPYGWQDDCVK